MIPAMGQMAQNQGEIAEILGGLLVGVGCVLCFSLLALAVSPLLLRFVMRAGLFLVVAALPAEEEQDWLRVLRAHAPSFRAWRVVVKRSTMLLAQEGNV
jgi:hypothetical protein